MQRADPLIGQDFGPYQLIAPLGFGGQATIYRAYESRLDRDVALKVFRPSSTMDATFVARFEAEARAIAGLTHPHILPVHSVGEHDGMLYIAMQLIEGGTLRDRLHGPMCPADAYFYVEQLADALDYAHAQGIVHLDVKPSNALLTRNDHLYLSDFGLACLPDRTDVAVPGLLIGTPEFVAPEVGQHGVVSRQSDAYALGVVLYQLLMGAVPYTGDEPLAIVLQHVSAPLPTQNMLDAGYPDQLADVVGRAMAKQPDDRFHTAGELSQALGAAVEAMGNAAWQRLDDPGFPVVPPAHQSPRRSQPMSAPRSQPSLTPVPVVAAQPRRHRWLIGTAVALVVAVATTTAVGVFTRSSADAARPAHLTNPTPVPTSTAIPFAPLSVVAAMHAGKSLCDVAVDDGGDHVFVTDHASGQLLVLNTTTQQQTGSFDFKGAVCTLALDQSGHTVYLPVWHTGPSGAYNQGEVLAVDVFDGGIKPYRAPHFPSGSVFDARTKNVYVPNTEEPSLLVIDTLTGEATDSIGVGVQVNRVALAASIGRLYLTSPESNKLLVFEPLTRKIVATIPVGTRPWDVVFDAKTGLVLVSSEAQNQVAAIDPQTNRFVWTVGVGKRPQNLAIDSARGVCYVLNAGDRTLTTIRLADQRVTTSSPLPGADNPTGLALATESGQVFVVSKQQVYVLR
jgi:serine/threonine-protein kinase